MPCFSVLLEAFYLGMMPELKRRHAELLSEQRTEVGGFPESEFKGQITDRQAVILLQETARFLKFQVQQILHINSSRSWNAARSILSVTPNS